MKHLMPDRVELCVLAVLAAICGAVVSAGTNADYLLALLSIPLFITAAVMGLRRNWKLAEMRASNELPDSPAGVPAD